MSIVNTVVGRPTTFLIIFVLLSVLGFYAATNLGIDFLPEIENPVLTVITTYTGAGPREIEDSITTIIESAVANIKNVESIKSEVQTGISSTLIEFKYGTDLNVASSDVRDNLGFIDSSLPSGTDTQILKLNTQNIPILVYHLSGNRNLSELYRLAEDTVRPLLERIDGVARVTILGAADPVVRIEVPQERLDAYSFDLQGLAGQIAQNNSEVAGGQITDGGLEYLVETDGAYKSLEEISNALVGYRGIGRGQQTKGIFVRDIADVFIDYDVEGTNEVFVDGNPAIFIAVQKQSQANTVATANNVENTLPQIEQRLPSDLDFNLTFSTAALIRDTLNSVTENAFWGIMLAVLILYIFLRSVRATLVISISIPISVVVTLMCMYFLNLTLNLMTLSGLALGVGMLVDNSIVILENIFRYRNRGVKLFSSAVLGSKEMVTPITSSTLTTVCVFLPLALFRDDLGVIGELFVPLALTVVIALFTSLFVAVFLVPVLSSHYFRLQPSLGLKKGFFPSLNKAAEKFFLSVERVYKSMLLTLLRHRYWSFLALTTLLIVLIVFIPSPPFEAFPRGDSDNISLSIILPAGTQSDITKGILFDVERHMKENYATAIKSSTVEIGESVQGPGIIVAQGHLGTLTLYLPEESMRVMSGSELEQVMRKQMNNYPSVTTTFSEVGPNVDQGALVQVKLRGNDYNLLQNIGEQILAIMQSIPGFEGSKVENTEPMPQIGVQINRQRAYSLGVSMATIASELKGALSGVDVGKIELDGIEYGIKLSLPDRNKDELPDLTRLFVTSRQGTPISLSNLVSFERGTSPQAISREDQVQILEITSDIDQGYNASDLVPQLERQVNESIPFNEAVTIEFAGSYQDFLKNVRTFALFAFFALLLVYGIMASLFESFLDPLIILFTIPLTFVGVLIMYASTGDVLNSFTIVGFIMLFGIVVNNGIVLVDYTNLLKHRNIPLFEACAEAGRARLRPILMTTMTTVFGMLPIAFVAVDGAELVQPIAKTVVGGLAGGSLLTLFYVPVLYAIFNVWGDKARARYNLRVKKQEELFLQQHKIKEEQAVS